MHRVASYLLSHFFRLFISIFLPLLAVASIIILIKIATVTAIVKLDATDMYSLYFYILPQVVVFTLPIAFFVAGALTINHFSNDNEIIVLFALGVRPNQLLRILFWPALWLTGVMLSTSLLLVPHAQQLYDNYITFKRTTATLNIAASEFGQRFGEWILFIEEENIAKSYKNVALFRPMGEDKKEYFAIADSARFSNVDQQLRFRLTYGRAFIYDTHSMTQINFDRMQINDTSLLRQLGYQDSFSYWESISVDYTRRQMFIISVMLSLMPLLNIVLILAIGIQNNRHQKNFTVLYLFAAVVGYFGLFLTLMDPWQLDTFYIGVPIWLALSGAIYYYRILRRY